MVLGGGAGCVKGVVLRVLRGVVLGKLKYQLSAKWSDIRRLSVKSLAYISVINKFCRSAILVFSSKKLRYHSMDFFPSVHA